MFVRMLIFVLLLSTVSWGEEPPVFGALYNLTGAQSSLDTQSANGARLAAEELGMRVVVRDGETEPARLKALAGELLTLSPLAVFGLSDTDMVLACAPTVTAQGVPFVTSGATSPRLPAQVPGLFLACFGDNVQAAAAAEFLYREKEVRTVCLLWNSEMEYTRLLSRYFRERFEELGGRIVLAQAYQGGFGELELEADAVYLASGPEEASQRVTDLREAGFDKLVFGGDSFDGQKFASDKVYFTTHAFLQPEDPFVLKYRKTYGATPDAFAALGYDTVALLHDALSRASAPTPSAVAEALAATRGFKGLTGTISYREGSRIPLKSVAIVEGSRLAAEWMPESVPAP